MSPSLNSTVIPQSEVPREEPDRKQTRPVVLVVDDERIIADTLSIILGRSGYSTYTAYDGETALDLAETFPPQLLISDVVMPGMTGVELAISVVEQVPGCKILLFSGQAATADLLSKARACGHEFTTLSKPIHPTEMLAHVSRSLNVSIPAGWMSHAERAEVAVSANA
jgi:CheY-like chemotaxis protein